MKSIYKYLVCLLMALSAGVNASADGDMTINDVFSDISYNPETNILSYKTKCVEEASVKMQIKTAKGTETTKMSYTKFVMFYSTSMLPNCDSNCMAIREYKTIWTTRFDGNYSYNEPKQEFEISQEYEGGWLTFDAEWKYLRYNRATKKNEVITASDKIEIKLRPLCEFKLESCTEKEYNSIEGWASYAIKWSYPDGFDPTSISKYGNTLSFEVHCANSYLSKDYHYILENVDKDGCTLIFPDLRRILFEGVSGIPFTAKLVYKTVSGLTRTSSVDFNCKQPLNLNFYSKSYSSRERVNVYTCYAELPSETVSSHEIVYKDFNEGYVCLLRNGKIIDYKLVKYGEKSKFSSSTSSSNTRTYYKLIFTFEDWHISDGEEYSYTHAFFFDKPDFDRHYNISENRYVKQKCTFTNKILGVSKDVIEQANSEDPTGPKLKGQRISWESDYTGDSDLYYRVTVDGKQSQKFTFKGSDKNKEWYHVPKNMTMPEGTKYIASDDVDEYHNHSYLLEAFVHENDTIPFSVYEWKSVGTYQPFLLTELSASDGEYSDRICVRAKVEPLEELKEDPIFIISRRLANKPATEFVNIGQSGGNGKELFYYDDHVDPGVKYEYKVEAYMHDRDKFNCTKFTTGSAKLEGQITGNITLEGGAVADNVTVRLEIVNDNQDPELEAITDVVDSLTAVTDANGNFIIRNVPIVGTGTSYRIIPEKGEHQFQPESVQRTLGRSTSVVQGVDFKDTSSFPFYLHVTYDGTNIPVDSVQVYVDGHLAQPSMSADNINTDIDINNAQNADTGAKICTDKDGFLKIELPQGPHNIQLQRKGHTFANDGYWPAKDVKHDFDASVGSEFEPIEFRDVTRVIMAGRVVGGIVQAKQPWTKSKANIGEATLRMRLADQRYRLNTTDKAVSVDTLRTTVSCEATVAPKSDIINIRTNAGTGEFFVAVPPVNFILEEVKQVGGTLCSSATTGEKDFGDVAEVLVELVDTMGVDTLTLKDGSMAMIHGGLAVTYRSEKQVELWDKSDYCGRNTGLFGDAVYEYYDKDADETKAYDLFIDGKHALGRPVFTNKNVYNFGVKVYETYQRPGADPLDADVVPLIGEKISMINGMGSTLVDKGEVDVVGTYNDVLTLDSLGEASYRWEAGFPKFADDHVLSLAVRAEDTGKYIHTLEGYVMGDIPIEGSNFVTWPQSIVTDVVHDPFGSGSYAYRESEYTTMRLSVKKDRSNYKQQNWHVTAGIGAWADMDKDDWGFNITNIGAQFHFGEDGESIEQTINNHETELTIARKETITTSSDVSGVGPDADIFSGYAINTVFSDANGLWLQPKTGSSAPASITDFEFRKEACKIVGVTLGTRFSYTRAHIRDVEIPTLEENIKDILRHARYMSYDDFDVSSITAYDEPMYITFYKETDEEFATNLEAPYDKDKSKDNNKGCTYACILPATGNYENLVAGYAHGISMWEQSMAQDEKHMVDIKDQTINKENLSISRGGNVAKSMSLDVVNASSSQYEYDMKRTIEEQVAIHVVLIGADETVGTTIDSDYAYTFDKWTTDKKTTYGYVLQEDVEGSFLSQDVIEPSSMYKTTGSYSFILRGGQTENPYQKALQTEYLEKYYSHSGYKDQKVGEDTQNLSAPVLYIKNGEGVQKEITYDNLRIGQPVYVTLQLSSLSPQNFKPENYLLTVPRTNQTGGLNMTVGGTNIRSKEIPFTMYQNETTEVTLAITPTQTDTLDYENIVVRLCADGWDSWTTYSDVKISLHYTPSAGDVNVKSPSTVVNTETKAKANLIVDGYDRMQNGFACIDLMYRKVGDPQFEHTFARFWKDHKTATMKYADRIPFVGNEKQAVIDTINARNIIYHEFDMGDPSIYEDGDYEIQAMCRALFVDTVLNKVTVCENASEPWLIHKDTTRPQILGKTLPVEGVLDANGQIGINFTEDIDPKYITKDSISITAQKFKGEIPVEYTMSDRTLIIHPRCDLMDINNDEVTVCVKGIRDMAGNKMADDPTWKVKVDWLPLKWEPGDLGTNLGTTIAYMSETPLTVKVKNYSNRQRSFSISGVTNWMSIYPMEGTVGPFSETTLTVLANDRLPLGTQVATATMNVEDSGSDMGYSNSQTMRFAVKGIAPDWKPARKNTEDNMSMIVTVRGLSIGAQSSQGDDLVGVFAGDECVGVGKYIKGLQSTKAAITIYEPSENLPLTFKIWEARTGNIFYTTLPDTTLYFRADDIYGGLNVDTVTITASNARYREIELNHGHNWISLGLDTKEQTAAKVFYPVTQQLQGNDMMLVKTMYNYFMADKSGVGMGTLNIMPLKPQDMLSVYMSGEGKRLPVIGDYQAPENVTFNLNGNLIPTNAWTPLTYVYTQPLDVKYALSRFNLVDGDLIKSREKFAVYLDGEWHGSLSILQPNGGYMFGSNTTKTRTVYITSRAYTQMLSTPDAKAAATKAARSKQATPMKTAAHQDWTPSPGYGYNMCVRAIVCDGEEQLTTGQVGCFDAKGECRGAENISEDGMCYLTIVGDKAGEPISFFYSDDEGKVREASVILDFEIDGMVGIFEEPFCIQLAPISTGISNVGVKAGYRIIESYDITGSRINPENAPKDAVIINLVERPDGSREYVKTINK